MDDMILLSKLESLKHCLERIQSKMPISKEALHTDWDLQDIMTLNLQRAVQTCVDIAAHLVAELSLPTPMNMAESFARLEQAEVIRATTSERMMKSVGFRNVIVHAYETILQRRWDIGATRF